ncbi:MAG: hypothetical protein ACTSWX_09805 [Promethearchaeota archaeon]
MRFFCPNYQDHPEETDKKTFLALMLKKRPEYAIVWDVTGKDVREFHKRVWVTQYVVINDNVVYYSQSKHYATRAQVLYNLKEIVHVETDEQWDEYLPVGEMFKTIRFYSPYITEEPEEIALEDFINKMIEIRPRYAVLWDVSFEDVEYISSRAWVVSYMPVIGDTIYYSYSKQYAFQAQKKFEIPKRKKIKIQEPEMGHLVGVQS